MKGIRIHYTEKGWIADVPFALNVLQLTNAINYHKKIQIGRIKTMVGDKRKACEVALQSLNVGTLHQNVLPNQYKEHVIIGGGE